MGLFFKKRTDVVSLSGFNISNNTEDKKILALAGNPNVGKRTLFNSLTGLKQHTGNWPGQTVDVSQGNFRFDNATYQVVDIPGTYSLMSHSAEEEVARDYLCFGNPDAVIVVCDATCLQRNLNLVLQVLEITNKVIVCINLMDEAKKLGIEIDIPALSAHLGIPVVGISARHGTGINKLMKTVSEVLNKKDEDTHKTIYPEIIENSLKPLENVLENDKRITKINCRWLAVKLIEGNETLLKSINTYLHFDISSSPDIKPALDNAKEYLRKSNISAGDFTDTIVTSFVHEGAKIANNTTTYKKESYSVRDRKADRILTGRFWAYPIMLLLLAAVFWITITGANYPSALLSAFFTKCEQIILNIFTMVNMPIVLSNMLVFGVFRVTGWVISVMLPPMAIFFPLFTILEDLGYLPRIAFNLDNAFKKCCACGKQALTMC